jgi:hypothetical protein
MVLLILHFDAALWFSLQTQKEGNNVSPSITEVVERLQSSKIATRNDSINSKLKRVLKDVNRKSSCILVAVVFQLLL